MIINNMKYFMLNILISVFSLFLTFLNLNTLTILLIAMFLYIFFGFLSKYLQGTIKNLFSFSFLAIFGLAYWIICYIISPTDINWLSNPNANCWGIYILFFNGLTFLNDFFRLSLLNHDLSNGLLLLPLTVIPTLLFWVGSELRIFYNYLFKKSSERKDIKKS